VDVNEFYTLDHVTVASPFGTQTQPQTQPVPSAVSKIAFLVTGAKQPFSDIASRFSDLRAQRREAPFIEALQIIDPSIKGAEVLVTGAVPALCLDIGLDRPVPINLFGDGLIRYAEYVARLYTSNSGLLLIDEIEAGIHYSVLEDMWSHLGQIVLETGAQIVATTHSQECVTTAIEALQSFNPVPLHLYRMRKPDPISNATEVISYDSDSLAGVLRLGLDVR
jgi:hypothetical protein